MTKGGSKLAKWTISYYVLTTVLAVVHSMILMDLVWSNLVSEVTGGNAPQATHRSYMDERGHYSRTPNSYKPLSLDPCVAAHPPRMRQ